MKKENKMLLLKDLCARLPYGVIVTNNCIQGKLLSIETNIPKTEEIVYFRILSSSIATDTISNIKYYLRPMSSMTEKEEIEFNSLMENTSSYFERALKELDWLNAHHFDYRGLIEKGLALEALEDMYNLKEK